MATIDFERPPKHIQFISWNKFLEWAQYLGFPFATVRGLRAAFRRKGGTYGVKAKAPHKRIPVPVEQAELFLGGHQIKVRKQREADAPAD